MKLTLCDNEIDCQYDQFMPEALYQLPALFVGKTVVFDYKRKTKDQIASIYSIEVEDVLGQTTINDLLNQLLTAIAYMLNLTTTE